MTLNNDTNVECNGITTTSRNKTDVTETDGTKKPAWVEKIGEIKGYFLGHELRDHKQDYYEEDAVFVRLRRMRLARTKTSEELEKIPYYCDGSDH